MSGLAPAAKRASPDRGGSPTTLASTVYELLRADILSAALLPEQRLGSEALRLRYNVGASPLREALNRLVSERLVVQLDQRGFRVASVSFEELRELTHTRRLINEIALRESIKTGDAKWEEDILLSYHRLSRRDGLQIRGDADGLHAAFHRSLIAACGSDRILQLTQELFEKAKRYQVLSISPGSPPRDGADEHRLIMEAVLARDVERAVKLANDHVNMTEQIVLMMRKLNET